MVCIAEGEPRTSPPDPWPLAPFSNSSFALAVTSPILLHILGTHLQPMHNSSSFHIFPID